MATCAAIVVFGSVVKGALGVGLPLVAVPMLSLLMPAPRAMGVLMVPVLLSNLWQAWQCGQLAHARRFVGLIVAQLVATVLTVRFSQGLSVQTFNTLVALAVLSAVVLMALRPTGEIPPRHERWAGPLVGALAGIMGGISTLTGPVIIAYLMALRLKRDEFVGSISVVYLCGSVPMYASMLWWERFGWFEVGWSVVALVPMFIGLHAGGLLRRRISEEGFRRLLFAFLSLLAVALLFK
nr:sulfite exporter TauE/SafE family protein [Ramlibacter aurantiacus]